MLRMARSRWIPALIALAFVGGLAAVAIPAAADPQAELEAIEREQDALDEKIEALLAQKGNMLDKIAVIDGERATVERSVKKLDSKISVLNAKIDIVQGRLQKAQQELAAISDELNVILGDLVARTDIFTERAVAIYKAGPSAYLESILSSQDLTQLLKRYEYYESALEADNEMIDAINLLRSETDQKRLEVEERRAAIVKDKKKLERDKAAIAAIRTEKAGRLASLNQLLAAKQAVVEAVDSKRKSFLAAQARLEADSNQIKDLLAGSGPGPGGTGQLAWPVSGPVSSPYGWRTHPIFGDRRLHTGIDISVGYGSTVYSADRGTVSFVGVMGGYGNVVVVDHGGGLATTYNHLSAFSVSSGQTVGRGQPVGAVGCTGYCTGPHLHFEVRVNGSPVDPMPYLQ